MTPYPVHYSVSRPKHASRLQLLIRVCAFMALGLLGVSFGSIFAFAFVALPVYAASRMSSGDGTSFIAHDAPRVVRVLRWFAAVSAWVGLVSENLPGKDPGEHVHLDVEAPRSRDTSASSAIIRVITGLPSALILAFLCWIGVFVWLWAAITILVQERIGQGAFRYLVGLQRWSVRLLAYQASLVDDYPPFSFEDSPPGNLPEARLIA